MEVIIQDIITFLNSMPILGPILAFLCIVLESLIPFLPLVVFIGVLTYYLNIYLAYIVAYIAICLGSIFTFLLYRYIFKNKKYKLTDKFSNIKFEQLAILYAIPFSPSGFVHIGLAVGKYNFKKFTISLLIGKLFSVYFWVFISKTFIQSITDISTLVILTISLLIVFAISKLVRKNMKF
ncbi:MAG: VTT domain-containing protein [Bacilli bacterium]